MRGLFLSFLISLFFLGTAPVHSQSLDQQRTDLIQTLSTLPNSRSARDERANTYLELARVEVEMRQYGLARKSLSEAQILYRKTRNKAGQAYVHTVLGDISRYRANYDQGYVHYQEALSLFKGARDKSGRAETLWRLGELYRYQRQNSTARNYLEEAKATFSALKNPFGEGRAVLSLGQIRHLGRDFAGAYTAFREAAGHFQRAGAFYQMGEAWYYAGVTKDRRGTREQAWSIYGKALKAYRQSGDRLKEGQTLLALAKVETSLYKDGEAEVHLKEAQNVFRVIGHAEGEGDALRALGNMSRSLGENQVAKGYFREALSLYRLGAGGEKLSGLLQNLGDMERQFGVIDQARDYYMEALGLYEDQHNVLGQANVWLGLGLVDSGPDPDLALTHFTKSARFYNAAGMGAAADMAIEAGNRLRADISQ